jgi:hypothetical protein
MKDQTISQRLLMKHTATVHSSSQLTFVQKKIFNLFIYKAFPTIHEDKYHSVKVSDLLQSLSWSGNMNDRLKEALAGLTRENVRWNVLEKDKKNKWVSSSCLADVSIKGGMIEFSFGKFLREVLHNPNIYAKIDLDVQSVLESRDSLIVWEMASEELSSKKKSVSITPWIEWLTLCSMTSGEGSSYSKTYSLYKSKVLNKAIAEINAKTDLSVELKEQKEGRKVHRLAFHVSRKNSSLLPETIEDSKRDLQLLEQLHSIIENESKVEDLLALYSDSDIRRALLFFRTSLERENNGIKNPIAFFYKTLQEGWCSVEEVRARSTSSSEKENNQRSVYFPSEPEGISKLRQYLLREYGNTIYTHWFEEGRFSIKDGVCVFKHPQKIAQSFIYNRYRQTILSVVAQIFPEVTSFEVEHVELINE